MIAQRIFRLLMVSAALSPLAMTPAVAQMYPGQDVIVNPAGFPPAQPFGPGGYGKIVLKRPHRHHPHPVVAKTETPTDSATADISPPATTPDATPVAPPPKRKHHATQSAAASPPPADAAGAPSADDAVPFTLGQDEPLGAPTTKVAKAESPPAQTAKPDKAGSQQTSVVTPPILFEPSATEPQPSQLEGIKMLAGDLNTALGSGATQIQLQAFAGAPHDKSSDARRVSLKRALSVRQLLIDDGVPAARIVTRAMGGITDNGPHDRVDILVVGGG